MASGAILNNIRIRKIRKELGITKAEYDMLQKKLKIICDIHINNM
jgi:hypothetical protein